MKKRCIVLAVALFLSVFQVQVAIAEGLVNLQRVREQPVNVLEYAKEGIDLGAVIFAKLLKTMSPVAVFNKENKEGVGGFEVTLIENFLHPRLRFVGGAVTEDKKPMGVLLGVELKLDLKGDLGRAISQFRPGVYWAQDQLWLGVSLGLGRPTIQPLAKEVAKEERS